MLQRLTEMNRAAGRSVICLVALSLMCGRPRSAQAAAPEASAAQALFDEAKALMARGDYQRACAKLDESQRLDPALGTLLNLADCREKEGKLASAWSLFRDAEALAHRAGPADAEAVAHERARALDERVPRLLISVAPGQPVALKIARNGIEVGAAQWETPIPLDPGEYQLTATAPGYKSWQSSVTLKERAGTVKTLVPALVPAAQSNPAVGSEGQSADLKLPPANADSHSVPTASWVLGGVGVAAIGLGAGLAVSANSQYYSVDCPDHRCSQDDLDVRNHARTKATIATVAFIGGGLALGAGVVLWATQPSPAKTNASRLSLRAGMGSLVLDGAL